MPRSPRSVLIVPSLLAAVAASAAASEARLPLEPCARPGLPAGALCGRLEVAESPAEPEGRRIGLELALLPATGETVSPDPLVVLEGGPGASVLRFADLHAATFAAVRGGRDLVLLDQRGTGLSHPLDCPRVRPGADGLWPLDEVRDCAARLAAAADPRRYLTSFAVSDLDAVRDALGYEKLNLFGVSYGTRTALEYLRRHPQRVRSAVLLAPYPPGRNVPLEAAPIAQRSLELLFEACRLDASCRDAFPDPAGDLRRALARFGADGGARWGDETLRRDLFVSTLRLMLFFPQTAARLPLLLRRAAEGDFGPYQSSATTLRAATGDWISTGAFLSLLCSEDVAGLDREAVRAGAGSTFLGAVWTTSLMDACAEWPAAKPPADFHDPVTAPAPLLLLSGRLDPAMPPSWGQQLARDRPGALFVEIPEGHHSLIGMSRIDCVLGLMEHFVAAGSSAGLDASCVGDMRRPPFVIP